MARKLKKALGRLTTKLESTKIPFSKANSQLFRQFATLPVEIRLKIWRATLPGQRVVEIYYHRIFNYRTWIFKDVTRSSTLPPVILRVCHESRAEALRFYLPLAHCDISRCYSYFNPTIDMVYVHFPEQFIKKKMARCSCRSLSQFTFACNELFVPMQEFTLSVFEELGRNVQYLAVNSGEGPMSELWTRGFLGKFERLKELTLVWGETGAIPCYSKKNVELEQGTPVFVPFSEVLEVVLGLPPRVGNPLLVDGHYFESTCKRIEEVAPEWVRPELREAFLEREEIEKHSARCSRGIEERELGFLAKLLRR